MPNPKLYMPSAPGRLKLVSASIPSAHETVQEYLPKESKCKKPSREPAMNSVDTKQHFGACRTWQGLTDGKDLLVLEAC